MTYAKDQPEYAPLPALRNKHGVVLTRWTFNDAERAAIAAGADVFLYVWTFRDPLQPLALEVAETPRPLVDVASFMDLL